MKNITMLMTMAMIPCMNAFAQNNRTLTLEDLLPGGETFYQNVPENIYGLTWKGDLCIRPDVEALKTVNPKNGKEETILTLETLNSQIESKGGEKVQHFYGVEFPFDNDDIMRVSRPGYVYYYDFAQNGISKTITLDKGAQNITFAPVTENLAYTKGSDLFFVSAADGALQEIKSDKDGIVYGQAVHRNEFGIMGGIFWSPDGQKAAFYKMDESMVTKYPLVDIDHRIAQDASIRYPMAGMTSHKVYVGIHDMATGKDIYLQTGDPTDRYFTNIAWAPDASKLYVIELNRDQNHSQLVRYDAATGQREEVLIEETSDKYVEPMHPIMFVKGNDSQFIYQSQRDGFNHLYLYGTDGKLVKQLTKGEWLVQSVLGFNEKGSEIFFTATEASPIETNLYKVNMKNGKMTRLTPDAGWHTVTLSGSGKYFVDSYSAHNVPRVVNIATTDGKYKTTNLLTAANPFADVNMPEIELGTIKAADGVTDLYYRLIKPANFDASKKYPAIIYVYGGPHAQMIHDSWMYSAGGWDIYMAMNGYVMLTVDNRGSENRGMEFESCTFRHLGINEGTDQVEGVKMLTSLPYVDASRIGVHGWSFGGHMTTALMLRYPEIFKVGVAGGPVIDWKFYEVMYGERYMDTPQANPEGYQETNLNELAGNLKGRLMIVHDYNDKTCVPQHALSFIKSCVDKRTYPDLFIYPGHDHNVLGRDRVHLYENITRYFMEHL